jgi:hypothetical protein
LAHGSRIGIVGHGADKFTPIGARNAARIIRVLVGRAGVVVSGNSPLGGVDVWAEIEAKRQFVPTDIKDPDIHQWNPPGGYGYKARNLDIAGSDEVHCIVVDSYPPSYRGRRFPLCYHCGTADHVKSGGCWTMKKAARGYLHIVSNEEEQP